MSLGGKPNHPGLLEDTTRAGLEIAWQERAEEADVLLRSGYRSLGFCLKVYALETRLKLRICDHLRLEHLPKAFKTHDLNELILCTGLWAELNEPINAAIKDSFDLLVVFSKTDLNSLRYRPRIEMTASASTQLSQALDDPIEGFLPWLNQSR